MGKIKINVDNSGSNVAITFLVQKRATNAVTGAVGDWMYFGGSVTGEDSGKSINAGASQEFAVNTGIANGTGREHRYSTDGGSTWTEIGSKLTISCASVSTSIGACSDSQTQTPSITLNTGADSTVSVFYRVEYSNDGGSNWTQLKSDEEVTANSSETYSAPALANGESIQWRYSSRKSGGSHDNSTWVTDGLDIPGVDQPQLLQPQLLQLQLQQQQPYQQLLRQYLNQYLNLKLLIMDSAEMMEVLLLDCQQLMVSQILECLYVLKFSLTEVKL